MQNQPELWTPIYALLAGTAHFCLHFIRPLFKNQSFPGIATCLPLKGHTPRVTVTRSLTHSQTQCAACQTKPLPHPFTFACFHHYVFPQWPLYAPCRHSCELRSQLGHQLPILDRPRDNQPELGTPMCASNWKIEGRFFFSTSFCIVLPAL